MPGAAGAPGGDCLGCSSTVSEPNTATTAKQQSQRLSILVFFHHLLSSSSLSLIVSHGPCSIVFDCANRVLDGPPQIAALVCAVGVGLAPVIAPIYPAIPLDCVPNPFSSQLRLPLHSPEASQWLSSVLTRYAPSHPAPQPTTPAVALIWTHVAGGLCYGRSPSIDALLTSLFCLLPFAVLRTVAPCRN